MRYFLFLFLSAWFGIAKSQPSLTAMMHAADSCMKQENYIRAMNLLTDIEIVLEDTDSTNRILALVYYNLAVCFDYFDYTELSTQYFTKALPRFQSFGDLQNIAYCLTELGDSYEDGGNNKTARIFQLRALAIFKQLNDSNGIAKVYDNLSSIYENYSLYDSSLYYLNSAFKLYTDLHDTIGQCVVLNNLGDIELKKGNNLAGLNYYKQSLLLSQLVNNHEEERGNLKDIARCYSLLGNYKLAYEYFNHFFAIHRKLKIEKKIDEVAALQIHSLQAKKEFQIQQLNSEKELSTLRFSVIIISLILFIVILFNSYQSYRSKVKRTTEQRNAFERDLQLEIEIRKEKLANYTRQLAERAELIESLKKQLTETFELNNANTDIRYKAIEQLSNSVILTDDDWVQFKKQFENVYEGFFVKLRETYPDLSIGDIRLASLLKLKLSQEEIARMIGITVDGVKKASSRLKKKVLTNEMLTLKEWIENI